MRIRLLKHWNGRAPGHVFAEMPDGAANTLIRRGMAEEVTSDRSDSGPVPGDQSAAVPVGIAADRRNGGEAAARDDHARTAGTRAVDRGRAPRRK